MRTITRRWMWVVCGLVVIARAVPGAVPQRPVMPDDPVATFSILGYDPESGEMGGAVQSRVFSVGNGVLWAEANVGVVATQAIVDVSYGPQSLELLRKGVAPADVVKQVWDRDPDPGLRTGSRMQAWPKAGRQFAVLSPKGETAVFTGPEASAWAGHKQGKFSTAQGNTLAGPAVVADMITAFDSSPRRLAFRLRHAVHFQTEGHVLTHGHVRVKRVALEHHRDAALGGRDVVDHLARDLDGAFRRILQPGDHPQQGGLAAARGAEDREHLARGEVERDSVDGGVDRDGVAVADGHVLEPQHHQNAPTPGTRSRSTASITTAVATASTTEAASAMP